MAGSFCAYAGARHRPLFFAKSERQLPHLYLLKGRAYMDEMMVIATPTTGRALRVLQVASGLGVADLADRLEVRANSIYR